MSIIGSHKSEKQAALAGVTFIETLLQKLNIKPDFKYFKLEKSIIDLTIKSLSPGSMKNNPAEISDDALYLMLETLF